MRLFLKILQNILPAVILTAVSIFGTVHCAAQTPFIFTPAVDDEATLKSLAADFEKRYHSETNNLSAENKKDILELYKVQWEQVKEKFDKKEIYTSGAARQYLDALVTEIIRTNPVLQSLSFTCLFSRSGIPNASYIGEGVIIFQMGLFNKLQNESQVAFILCHEIAHFYLHHMENSINRYVTTLNSEEVQKELRKVKNTEYKKREGLEKLLKGIAFNSYRHSRDHESEADSMALVFMKPTRFDLSESLTALSLLDSIDTDTFQTNTCLTNLFNAKEYPFQQKWIAKEEGLLGGHATLEIDRELEDSLKTHPDCKLRVRTLEPMVKQYRTSIAKNIINQSKFEELKRIFSYEIIEYTFSSNNYTKSLFYTLQLLQDNPADPYLISQVGRIFNSLYAAQKSHRLGKLIDLPSPYFSSSYNQVLQFVQNLYLRDLSQISYNFLKQYNTRLDYYTPFKNIYNTSIQIAQ